MSLNISAYFRDKSNKVQLLDKPGAPETLAGFEDYREKFYGSGVVQSLGCEVLPKLAKGDLYAEGAELDALEREVRLLLGKLSTLAESLGWSGKEGQDHYGFRLNNILRAVERARNHPSGNGGVYIG